MPKGKWADKQGGAAAAIDEVVEEVAATLGENDEDYQALKDLWDEAGNLMDQMQDILYDLDRS